MCWAVTLPRLLSSSGAHCGSMLVWWRVLFFSELGVRSACQGAAYEVQHSLESAIMKNKAGLQGRLPRRMSQMHSVDSALTCPSVGSLRAVLTYSYKTSRHPCLPILQRRALHVRHCLLASTHELAGAGYRQSCCMTTLREISGKLAAGICNLGHLSRNLPLLFIFAKKPTQFGTAQVVAGADGVVVTKGARCMQIWKRQGEANQGCDSDVPLSSLCPGFSQCQTSLVRSLVML